MNATRDLDHRLTDHYAAERSVRAPDRVLAAALATIESTPQRHALIRLPWRSQNMNRFGGLAVAAVAVIVAGAVSLAVLFGGRPPTVGTDQSPTPRSTARPAPSPSSAGAASSPTQALFEETFESPIHGISVSRPSEWRIRPAYEPWTGRELSPTSPFADIIYERQDVQRPPSRPTSDSPLIAIASRPVDGADAWLDEQVAALTAECKVDTELVTIDVRAGVIVGPCEGDGRPMVAVTSVARGLRPDRGYVLYAYRINDMEWFKQFLETVRLEPEAAVDRWAESRFRHPFSVWLPPDSWEIGPVQADASVEFRMPGSATDGNGSVVGVVVRAIDGGRRDPCADSSEPLPLEGGVETVVDYLELQHGVTLSDERSTTVSGIPAIEADFEFDPINFCGPEPRTFAEQDGVELTEVFVHVPAAFAVRVTAFDIDGQHVVIWTWAETPEWFATADELIADIKFETP